MMNQESNNNDNQNQRNQWSNTSDPMILKLRSVNTLANIAIIAALVSLFIGGVFLSAAALICTIVAVVKLSKIAKAPEHERYAGYIKVMRTRLIASTIASAIAFAFNLYAFITVLPVISEMLNGGSIEDAMSSFQDAATSASDGQSGNMNPGGAGKDSVFG